MLKVNRTILCMFLGVLMPIFIILFSLPVLAITTSSQIGVSITVESCGDGVVNGSEQCDSGLSNGICPATCSASCTTNSCGGGGGSGPADTDTTPPTISNVVVVPNTQSASVSWSVSDNKGVSNVTLVYGVDTNYGQTGSVIGSYSSSLVGLVLGTKYYYKITATDTSANQSVYNNFFFTLAGDVAPPNISNIVVVPSFTTAQITFDTNEPATTILNYGITNSYGNSVSHTQSLLASHSYSLSGLLPNTTYHFNIIATDAAPYLNSGISLDQNFKTAVDLSPPPNVADLKLNTTQNSILLTWSNPGLNFVPDFDGVKILRKTSGTASGHNDPEAIIKYVGGAESLTDSNVLLNITYYYTLYSFDTSGNYSSGVSIRGKIVPPIEPKAEICDNSIDDDNNGKIDCVDSVCVEAVNCQATPPTTPPITPTSTVPGAPTSTIPTVPSFVRIKISDLMFWSGNKKIALSPNDDIITGLAGSELLVGVKKSALVSNPKKIVLKIGAGENHFTLTSNIYYSDIIFPNIGNNQAYLEVDYGDNQLDSLGFKINSLPFGAVRDGEGSLSGVSVVLYNDSGQVFDGTSYNQYNPWSTGVDGGFGWMVPNGRYYVVATKNGYYERKTSPITISNNVYNQNIELINEPKKILEVIDPGASLGQNVKNISKNIFDKTKAVTKISTQNIVDLANKVNELLNDPVVEQTATEVAPVVVGVVALSTLVAVSWLDLLSLLRFLFLQPLMLLGRKKRIKWGVVYNSLTKLPIDLVIVRLINAKTGILVQSKVTDGQGRYAFVIDSGNYRVEVKKMNFASPSILLKEWKTDGDKLDIYHGEEINVTEKNSLVTVNIPLDPIGANKTPKRLLRERFFGRLQGALSIVGLMVTAFSLYISPKWYMWALLFIHIGLLFVFRRLAIPKKPKGWGIVYDEATKKPIGRAVARLFDAHFNKLVAMEVTDSSGRYHFLAGNNKYYATFEHTGYELSKTEEIDLGTTKDDTVVRDVGLVKKK